VTWRRWRTGVAEPDGSFRRLTGHAIGWLYIASAVVVIGYAPTAGPARRILAVLLGLGAATMVCGVVMLWLPWHRWPRRWQILAIPPSLAISGFGNWVDPNPYLASISFFVLAVWAGTALRRGTVLALSPLFLAAYWLPLAIVAHAPRLASSAVTCTVICVVTGECLAWLTARLHELQARLREHDERRFQALVAASSDTTILFDPQGRITYVSPSAQRMLGRPAEALQGRTAQTVIADHVHPDDALTVGRAIRLLSVGRGSTTMMRFRVQHTDGTVHDIEGVGRNLLADEAVNGVLINLRDVSDRVALERAERHRATHDALTDLPNRELLTDTITAWCNEAGDGRLDASLVFLDLDRFKTVNDRWGHSIGDELLCAVASRLSAIVRSEDLVCRVGADEFVIALASPDHSALAESLAVRLLDAFCEPFSLSVGDIEITPSIGIAESSGPADALDLIRDADTAMYRAKGSGRNGYAVFAEAMRDQVRRRADLEQALRGALKLGELSVQYQPIIDLLTGELSGFEALMRWNHPELGMISPLEFIPIAEDTGLIVASGAWLLEEAATQLAQWRTERPDGAPPLHMSVNVSVRQLRNAALVDVVRGVLQRTGLPADALWLELTESGVFDDLELSLATLRALRGLGVVLCIDDFGTGYSSLTYLRQFPASIVKIDRSFVSGIGVNPDDEAIVRTVIAMAHALGQQVVAEGIETAEHRDWLRGQGCDFGQGYLYSPPRPAEVQQSWILKQQSITS
jgi:diguanylate cyclase (GGDEF)-like protein/PAS domain S-box-containing protein